jgi:hypothetical protein
VLLSDEAHRFREISANRYTEASARTHTPQVDDLMQVARVPLLLLDEHQVVRPGELEFCVRSSQPRPGSATWSVLLDGQYCCGGSCCRTRQMTMTATCSLMTS